MDYNLFLVYGREGPIATSYEETGFQPAFDLLRDTLTSARFVPDVVITGEFLFNLEEIINNREQVANLALEHNADVVLTPRSDDYDSGYLTSQANSLGFSNNGSEIPGPHKPQSVSLIFGKDGLKHLLIKSPWEETGQGVHTVPNRDYGVAICYELWANQMDPETLQNIEIILHTAREEDLLHTKARSLYLAGVPLEEIERTNHLVPSNIDENTYLMLGPNKDILRKLEIPVISGNQDPSTTGIVYLPDNWEIKHLEYRDSHASLNLGKLEV